ncbi:TadE family protein [Streptomyces sp. NPDC004647]|uniref:TadE family protein n=1 Tax=Streptomyces sp. NPDC004647 TaxID=3154671 RepID=UPI00339FC6C7
MWSGRGDPGRARQPDRGQVSIEFLGFLPILLAIALAVVQLGIGAYAASQAGTGARAAARTATLDHPVTDPETAGRASMSGWIAKGARIGIADGGATGGVSATATVKIPSIIPGVDFGTAEKTATMPRTPDSVSHVPRSTG